MHDKDPNVREETNQLRRRSKGTKLMNNFDQMTRRDFMARVTTLAGGVAVATSAGMLAGCGSDNGSSGGTNFPTTPNSPGPNAPDKTISQLATAAIITPGTTAVLTKVGTLTAVDAASVALALMQAAVGTNPAKYDQYAFPLGGYTDQTGQIGYTTGKDLGMSPAETLEALTNLVSDFISAGLVSFQVGQDVKKEVITSHGTTYTGAAITDPTSGVTIFDPGLTLIPSNSSLPGYSVNQDKPHGNTAQGRYTNFNYSDGHTITDVAALAVLNTEVNGNLNTSNPANPSIQSASADPATQYDPTPPAKSVEISKAPNGRDIVITIHITAFGINFTITYIISGNCLTIIISWYVWRIIHIKRGIIHLIKVRFSITFHACLPTGGGGTSG